MLNSFRRIFVPGHNLFVAEVCSPTRNLCFRQLTPFSSASIAAPKKPTSKAGDLNNFALEYLINKLGFSPENAISASKHLKFKSVENPDSVVALLKNNGFTQEHIATMVRKFPCLISCDPQKNLLPKIDYFRSSGISETDVIDILVSDPQIFRLSLEKKIVPRFDCLKNLFHSKGTCIKSFKRIPQALRCDFGSKLLPNVEILGEAGVQYPDILNLMQYQPRAFMVDTETFREVVAEVKQMWFNPLEFKFVLAVHALRSMTKSSWENKIGVYMKWGWSKDECISAFLKQPYIMVKSEDHIMKVMDLLVNKMGFHASLVSKTPYVFSYSYERRVKPRCSVYKFLWDKGLRKKGDSLPSFCYGESDFLKRFVLRFEKEAPELLQLYQKELAVLK
ncbi:hypothetical protein OROGR_014218 [Orobanche gracilis]